MSRPEIHRRDFLKGCCAATLAGSAGNSYAVFDATTSLTQDTLVVVFLRGAMDALSLVSPGQNHPDRGNYEDNRVDTRIPYSGTGAGTGTVDTSDLKVDALVLAACGVVGFAFFLLELVWYRMLAPLLGGSVFTFGLILAMCSVGLSLIFGTTGLTNFAHGEMVTFGAMIAFLFSVTWGWNFYISVLVAVVGGGLFGLVLNEAVFSPLRERHIGLVSQLVVTVGLSIFLKNFFLYRFGGRTKQFAAFNNQPGHKYGPITITTRDLTTALLSLVLLIVVALALQRTRLGKATRAVSDNAELASSTGIDSQMIIRLVWFLGGALAATGGVFRGLDEGVSPTMGADLLFLLFAGITLGGLGSAYGALVGGFIVGMFVEVSTLGMPVFPKGWPRPLSWLHSGVPTELKNVPALLILVVILLVRPQGILGRRERVG